MNGAQQNQPPLPPMQPVKSSHLAQAGHDPVTKTLSVSFHNGDLYQYADVPTGAYISMLAAKSIGQFFNAKIRGQYPARKLHDHRQK